MSTIFLEVVLNADDMAAAGFESRDEVEDPLSEALEADRVGEVTGGGAGRGKYVIDVELESEGFDQALAFLLERLRELGVPRSNLIKQRERQARTIPVHG